MLLPCPGQKWIYGKTFFCQKKFLSKINFLPTIYTVKIWFLGNIYVCIYICSSTSKNPGLHIALIFYIKNKFFANNLYSQNLIFGQYLCMYTYFFINIQKSWPPYCPHIVHLILFLSVLKYIDIDIDEKHKTETFFSSTLVFLKLKYKLWHNLPEKIQFEIYNIWNVQYLILSCIY